jgi:transcription factor TGA
MLSDESFFSIVDYQMLIPQLDPLTEQQLLGMCNLRQSSEQAEEALEQGLQQLNQSLADAVRLGPLNDGASVANYTGLMAPALDKLDSLESLYRQVTIYSLLGHATLIIY